ncbi:MAG: SDR family oxidoreductase [Archangium sp.]|nr:SDR family oxidoreductase [Archangium sp.]
MTRKIALVTGGNKGIGFEVARQLGQAGFTVLLAARDVAKARAAATKLSQEKLDVRPVELDVTKAEQRAAVAAFIGQEFGHLDVLINNAGINLEPKRSGAEMFRETYETNVIAPNELTQVLLPLIQKSEAGRIVNQSSVIGSLTVISSDAQAAAWAGPAYASSKAALNMLTVLQATRLKDTKVKINSAHPGWVKTELGGDGAPLDVTTGAKTAVRLAQLPADGPSGKFFHLDDALPW